MQERVFAHQAKLENLIMNTGSQGLDQKLPKSDAMESWLYWKAFTRSPNQIIEFP